MRRHMVGAAMVFALTLVAFAVMPLMGASAGPNPVPKATGSIEMSDPMQYLSFNAFDFAPDPDRGQVTYTNFTYYPVAGTNVWNISGTHALVFGGGAYPHHINVTSIEPLSTHSTSFSGTGTYDPDPSYTWTVHGTVDWEVVTFHIVYTGTNAGYEVSGSGTIAANGSVSGTALDSNGLTLPWTMPAGSAVEVLSYSASVTCAVVVGDNATFGFTIPSTMPAGLAGLSIVMKVHDGGTPGTNGDTYAHGVATSTCDGTVTPYEIVGGNLVVH